MHSSEDWWDVKGAIQSLDRGLSPDDPFKVGAPAALRSLPGGNDPKKILIDPAHTWAIVGIGKDMCASSLLCMAHMGIFGSRGSLKRKLETAYEQFDAYVAGTGKHTSIADFSYKTLKCGPSNRRLYWQLFLDVYPAHTHVGKCKSVLICTCLAHALRYNKFPGGLGKGHDAAVIGSWLHVRLQEVGDSAVEP